MDRQIYRTGQFAEKAAVTERTLRFYDKVGLLAPSQYSEAGYRLYTDDDLLSLQQILAFKFLGFSLDEIKALMRTKPDQLQKILEQQKALMQEKRRQLDSVIQAIEETEQQLQRDQDILKAVVNSIRALHMEKQNDWTDKYFTPEQRQMIDKLRSKSYTPEAEQRLKQVHANAWTEEDQKRVDEQYAYLASELKRLVATGADPASPEAQALAKFQQDLIAGFTKNDPTIEASLRNWWGNYHDLPQEQRPFALPYSAEEAAFLQQACTIFREQNR
jgi:DNA-binding transcriptional MerR regulator